MAFLQGDFLNNATLNGGGGSGSKVFLIDPGQNQASLITNLLAAPGGQITWTISEVDPVDQTTVVGATVTGIQNILGVQVLTIAMVGRYALASWVNVGVNTKVDASLAGNTSNAAARLASIDAKVSTAANQATEIASLASIDGKTPALVNGASPVGIKNPTAEAMGSQAATGASVALGAATTYTGGILIWNSDTSLPVFVGKGTITAAAGANKVCLGPGQGYTEATGDLSAIQIIAASGGPIVNWVGLTL